MHWRPPSVFSRLKLVRIDQCVHFCAYRYGRREINPYEQYATALANGTRLEAARQDFVEYLRHYRPTHLGEALGVGLSRPYPLWSLPWRTPRQAMANRASGCALSDVVDVMTFFSDAGIPAHLVAKEFQWHEKAFDAIRAFGYDPRRYTYITVRELRASTSAYLVLDGNHRLSALSALGHTHVEVRQRRWGSVQRNKVDSWPLVRSGMMRREDALRVFDAYFEGNRAPFCAEEGARLV